MPDRLVKLLVIIAVLVTVYQTGYFTPNVQSTKTTANGHAGGVSRMLPLP